MIKVYFESTKDGQTSSGSYAELVAVFNSDELYNKCLPALEIAASEADYIVTESVEDTFDIDDFIK